MKKLESVFTLSFVYSYTSESKLSSHAWRAVRSAQMQASGIRLQIMTSTIVLWLVDCVQGQMVSAVRIAAILFRICSLHVLLEVSTAA